MTDKPKPPARHAPKPQAQRGHPAVPDALRQADKRWQRTVRFGWDNGGRSGGKGGGKSGR